MNASENDLRPDEEDASAVAPALRSSSGARQGAAPPFDAFYSLASQLKARDEAEQLQFLIDSHRFIFDLRSVSLDLLQGGFAFGCDLIRFGAFSLPFDQTSFQIGPFTTRNTILTASQENGEISLLAYCFQDGSWGWFTEKWSFAESIARIRNGDDLSISTMPTAHMLLVSSVGCLNSRGLVSAEVMFPSRLNRRRLARGELPLFSYRVLTIDPDLLRMPGFKGADNAHASPRLHWRRGHVRKLLNGKVAIVRPCLVGDGDAGAIAKDYRVRGE